MAKGEQIKIICRIRPFLDHEQQGEVVRVTEGNTITLDNKRDVTRPFIYKSFASCYPPSATQETIFTQDVLPLVERVFEGYSSSVFTYGVTGSGKSYSLVGVKDDPGIILRVAGFLFETKQATQVSSIEITMSYMEILKETVFDILKPSRKNDTLTIREDGNRNVYVAGLKETTIETYDEFSKLFNAANKNRSTASTKLNSRSSRSHAILTFNVKTVTPVESNDGQQQEDVVIGKINLIDLAGSEDNRKSGNGKARLTESAAINKSLFVLGQVVEALNTGANRVPFRDSKLTRILQPVLGGNSLGMMIINIAPGQNFINDTINTLNFASRTKEIKNAPNVNVKRRKAITRKPMQVIQPSQTQKLATPATPRIASTTHHPVSPSLDRKIAAHNRSARRVTVSHHRFGSTHPNNNNNTTTTHHHLSPPPPPPIVNNKRLFSTYEQTMRASKRSRLSLQPTNEPHYRTMTTSSSIYRDTNHHRRSSIHHTTSLHNLQRWLQEVPLYEPTKTTTTATTTASGKQGHYHQQQQRPPHHRGPRTPFSESSEPSGQDDEDMVIMTRADFDQLRDQMLLRARQEVISSRHGSQV